MAEQATTKDPIRTLIDRAERYCKLTGISRSTLGLTIFSDTSFFSDLEDGRDLKLSTYRRAWSWLDEHWPTHSPPTQPAARGDL